MPQSLVRAERSASIFGRFAKASARATGSPPAFLLALALIILWLASGALFRFSDSWQLVINTTTTILTFLMVFVIQNTINRDSLAMHVKLDELIRVTKEASNALMQAEQLSEDSIESILRRERNRADSPPA